MGNEAQLGQMIGMFNDLMSSGKPEMSKVAGLLGNVDSRFWKGALVGAALTLLISSPAISGSVAGLFSGLLGKGAETGNSAREQGGED